MARKLFKEQLPNVRGGNAIVNGTQIGVHDVVGLIVNGSSVDDVVRSFPDLTRTQVYECLAICLIVFAYVAKRRGVFPSFLPRGQQPGGAHHAVPGACRMIALKHPDRFVR
jgi:uncharacterized protein (DUF433 family)